MALLCFSVLLISAAYFDMCFYLPLRGGFISFKSLFSLTFLFYFSMIPKSGVLVLAWPVFVISAVSAPASSAISSSVLSSASVTFMVVRAALLALLLLLWLLLFVLLFVVEVPLLSFAVVMLPLVC